MQILLFVGENMQFKGILYLFSTNFELLLEFLRVVVIVANVFITSF